MPSLLFVCLGNICRSPLAEGAVRAEAARRGVEVVVDSAGTGNWHAGEPPDERAIAVAARNGVDIRSYRARQVTRADFARFDHIVGLDHANLKDLRRLAPDDGGRGSACCWTGFRGDRGRPWPIPGSARPRASTPPGPTSRPPPAPWSSACR